MIRKTDLAETEKGVIKEGLQRCVESERGLRGAMAGSDGQVGFPTAGRDDRVGCRG